MNTIWKYELRVTDRQEVDMPKGAQILSVQADEKNSGPNSVGQKICVWALVDDRKRTETHVFDIYGTGHECLSEKMSYLATVQVSGGYLVWHVFHYVKSDPRAQEREYR